MKNVKTTVNGKKLIIEVDLTQEHGPSKSGKTTIISSSEGPQPVPGVEGVKLNVNIYKK